MFRFLEDWENYFVNVRNGVFTEYCTDTKYRVVNEDGNVVLRMELPGISKDRVSIGLVQNNILKITVQQKEGNPYRYLFDITSAGDLNKITAKMEDGMLTITIPPKEEEKRNIPIS